MLKFAKVKLNVKDFLIFPSPLQTNTQHCSTQEQINTPGLTWP